MKKSLVNRSFLYGLLLIGCFHLVATQPGWSQDYSRLSADTFADLAERARESVVTVEILSKYPFPFSRGDMSETAFLNRIDRWAERNPGLEIEEDGFYSPRGGSGVIIDAEGHVLTSWHLFDGSGSSDIIRVNFADGSSVEGRDVSFIGSDALTDLAVLKVRKKNIRPISWGNSRAERPGNWVMILASPLDFDFSVSQGVISGMNRQVGSKVPIEDLIQTTAMINPGSSGGAMINLNGELIGIIMAMATRSDAWQGLGFAIPEKIARPVARSIIDHGYVKRGFLGINMEAITRFRARARQLPEVDGVLIEDVLEGYPAQRADLKSGDIIIAINNRPVTTPKDIFREIGTRFKNDTVKLTVMRPDGQLNLRIKLAESPPNKRIAEMLDPDAMERRRERMSEPGNVLPQPDETEEAWRNQPDLLKKLGMTVVPRLDAEDGLMVLAVRTDSPAAEAKLQVGDVLMRVGQTTVSGMVQLRRALLRQEGIAAPIFVIRAGEGKELLLPLTDLD